MSVRIALEIAATDTHCRLCWKRAGARCTLFEKDLTGETFYVRLPECIAATLPIKSWSKFRPISVGYFWLSFPLDNRPRAVPPVLAVVVGCTKSGRMFVSSVERFPVIENIPVGSSYFTGALWMDCLSPVVPTDPFVDTTT